MNIEDLTLAQIRQIQSLGLHPSSKESHPYQVGKNYHIRTVTHYYTGRLVEVFPKELVLEDAAWIPSDGRFSDSLLSGKFEEVEPFPEGRVIIGRETVSDAVIISSALPRSQI